MRSSFLIILFLCLLSLFKVSAEESVKVKRHNNFKDDRFEYQVENVNIGNCQGLDYSLYYCQKFSCNLTIPIGTRPGLKFTIIGKDKNGSCNIKYEYDSRRADGSPYPIVTRCRLLMSGIQDFRKDWYNYKKGYVAVFMENSRSPILQRDCEYSLK